MPVVEVVSYANEFKGAGLRDTIEGEPDREGLAEVLQSVMKDNPAKFTDAWQKFIKIDYVYLHRIIYGVKDALNEGKSLDWEKYFDFCITYLGRGKETITNEAHLAQGGSYGEACNLWIIDVMVDLIADGSKSDKCAFDPKYFEQVEKIFNLIVPFLKGETDPDTQRDALTYALNTTLGRVVLSYIHFSLKVAQKTKEKQKNWGNEKFERFLPLGIDGYIWMGVCLPQMYYWLDSDYTKAKIEFFSKKDAPDFQWREFMEGYLARALIYNDLYMLMRSNYEKAISCDVYSAHIVRRLVEHICIGYLRSWECLREKNDDGSDSLLWKLLMEGGNSGTLDGWTHITRFFWRRCIEGEKEPYKKKLEDEHKSQILKFWSWAFENQAIVKENLKDGYGDFLAEIAELTIILSKIGEKEEKWLLLSAPYVGGQHRIGFFIEYLARYDDEESVSRIGRIFRKILESNTPTFEEESIKSIVRKIYNKGDKKDADSICSIYGRRGVYFLKPVWEEFNDG